MRADLIVRVYIDCPTCRDYEFQIGHIIDDAKRWGGPREAGPWTCGKCGEQMYFIAQPDGTVDYEQKGIAKWSDDLAILRLNRSYIKSDHVFLVVHHKNYQAPKSPDDEESRLRYLYEEHHCPTNYIQDVSAFFVGNDGDAHGAWEYLGLMPMIDRHDPDRENKIRERIQGLSGLTVDEGNIVDTTTVRALKE